jgi:hypothetical protein
LDILNKIFYLFVGLGSTVLIAGTIVFLALKTADFINKKDGKN